MIYAATNETARTDWEELDGELRADTPIRAAPRAPALTLRSVRKRWGTRLVLDAVDLDVEPGSAVWIGGQNGVGKTTLLRIAAGLITPDAGHAKVEGVPADGDRGTYQRLIGFLSAGDRGLYARLSVRHNLEFWARLAYVPRRGRRAAVEHALEEFALADLAKARVDRLSMGQRQRVRLAMAILHDPSLVLLDEPLNSLDDEGAERLGAVLRRVADGGGAVVWCSPHAPQAPRFDGMFLLEGGRLREAR